jgi:signal transduction histidine kinase
MLERIESAFRRITQFTADASHELRAPLALIRATAEVGSRRTRKEEEYREAFTRIVTETERTTDLVESLLTLARADTGAVGLTKEELDLGEMLQEAYVRGRTMAEAKGLSLVADVRKPLWINGNTESIQRLLLIIIDNAVKYTSAGGKVSLAASAEDHYAIVKVADTGVGISEEDLPHVFERFYRADKARNRTERGTGLGLAIAKWIIEAHEGSIVCRSKVGAGSTFEIRIPLAGRQP